MWWSPVDTAALQTRLAAEFEKPRRRFDVNRTNSPLTRETPGNKDNDNEFLSKGYGYMASLGAQINTPPGNANPNNRIDIPGNETGAYQAPGKAVPQRTAHP